MRVTSGGVYFCSLAPGKHRFEEPSQRWQALPDLTEAGIKRQPYYTPIAMSLTITSTADAVVPMLVLVADSQKSM